MVRNVSSPTSAASVSIESILPTQARIVILRNQPDARLRTSTSNHQTSRPPPPGNASPSLACCRKTPSEGSAFPELPPTFPARKEDTPFQETSATGSSGCFRIHVLQFNFGAAARKEGLRRIVNNLPTSASPRLRVNPSPPWPSTNPIVRAKSHIPKG
jgi:hypothetical protein